MMPLYYARFVGMVQWDWPFAWVSGIAVAWLSAEVARLGVAFACVAVAFSVWPTQSAAVVKLSDQIAATELTTVPTQSVPNAEPIPATAAPATPIVAPEVVEDTSSASDIGVSGVLDASEPLTGVLKPGDAGTGVPAAGDATPR